MKEFQDSFYNMTKEILGTQIIFADKIEIDLNKIQVNKLKFKQIITLFLSIDYNGKTLKPFIAYPENFKVKTSSQISHVTTNLSINLQWIEQCILPIKPLLIISQDYQTFKDSMFEELLKKNSIVYKPFTPGSNCLLNPFRRITPKIVTLLEEKFKTYVLEIDCIDKTYQSLIEKLKGSSAKLM